MSTRLRSLVEYSELFFTSVEGPLDLLPPPPRIAGSYAHAPKRDWNVVTDALLHDDKPAVRRL